MTIKITVLSGANLCKADGAPEICPYVALMSTGPGRFNLGQTPCSVCSHPETQHPQWQFSATVDWFRCSVIHLQIWHYRPIRRCEFAARLAIPITSIPLGVPVTRPVPGRHSEATLTFQVEVDYPPPRIISPSSSHRRLYVYATYNPPIPNNIADLPVTFKLATVCDWEQWFAVFDEFALWQRIGKGSSGLLSLGPTGPTHVCQLNRGKCIDTASTVIVCSKGYQGVVTINFLLAKDARGYSPVHSLPRSETTGTLVQSSVTVGSGSLTSIPHLVRVVEKKYVVEEIVPLEKGGDVDINTYEQRFPGVLSPAIAPKRRVILPLRKPMLLADAATIVGVPYSPRIAIAGCWEPLTRRSGKSTRHTYHLSVILMCYDAEGVLCATHEQQSRAISLWNPPESTCEGRIMTAPSKKYQQQLDEKYCTYYVDRYAVMVDLSSLPQDVKSIAVVFTSERMFDVSSYKYKALRIVDQETGTELGNCPINGEWRTSDYSHLVGGLAFARDQWWWCGCSDNFLTGQLGDIWSKRLLGQGLMQPS